MPATYLISTVRRLRTTRNLLRPPLIDEGKLSDHLRHVPDRDPCAPTRRRLGRGTHELKERPSIVSAILGSSVSAEKLEQKLRASKKITDVSEADVDLLLTHPLIEHLVDRSKRGSHLVIVKVPYAHLKQFGQAIADVLGDPKVACVIAKDNFNVVFHGGKVKSHYVNDILELIHARRLLIEKGLERK